MKTNFLNLVTVGGIIAYALPCQALTREKPVTSKIWHVQIAPSVSLLGPIHYDSLAVFNKTGAEARNGRFYSYSIPVKIERMIGTWGSFLTRFQWREFSTMNNHELGNYTGTQEVGFERRTDIKSSGPAFGIGWNYVNRAASSSHWLLYNGVTYEKNTIRVSGYQWKPSEGPQAMSLDSQLSAFYADIGVGWRSHSNQLELEVPVSLAWPIASARRSSAVSDAEQDIDKRLRHRLKHGISIGLAMGFLP